MSRVAKASRAWILTALGKDRPGIVAGVTKILFELGGNLEDSAMSRLEGEFTMMVIFTAPAALPQGKLERAFGALSKRLGLVIHFKKLSRLETARVEHGKPYLISVYGADQPGIMYRVAALLSDVHVNITDVETHRTTPKGNARTPLYLMILEVELPSTISAAGLEPQLRRLAADLGVEVSLRSAETNVL